MRAPIRFLTLICALLAWPVAARAAPPAEPPSLASVHAVVLDMETGETLYAKHAGVPVPVASVTKLMTALVVMDSGQPLDEWLPIVDWSLDLTKNAYSRLRIGSEAQREELLRIALMSSENLATNVLASHHPGGFEAFVADMNARARTLGMNDSHFVDPAGLSPDNRSTAADLALLLRAAYATEELAALTTTYQHTARFRNPRYTLPYGNTNPLVASSRWDLELTKTGYLTEAGRCLVMVARVDDRPLGMVLLNSFGSRTPLGDAGRISRWITTGRSGTVAGAARDYERQQVAALLERREATVPGQALAK